MLRRIFTGVVLFAAILTGVGNAQATNSASADIGAELSLPISINTWHHISFGGFMPGATEGTVVLTPGPEAERTADGGVVLIVNYRGLAGELWVYGDPNADYELDFTTGPVTLTKEQGSATMTMSNITTYPEAANFVLDGSGTQRVYFGGTLAVGAVQENGTYYGSFEITASYL